MDLDGGRRFLWGIPFSAWLIGLSLGAVSSRSFTDDLVIGTAVAVPVGVVCAAVLSRLDGTTRRLR